MTHEHINQILGDIAEVVRSIRDEPTWSDTTDGKQVGPCDMGSNVHTLDSDVTDVGGVRFTVCDLCRAPDRVGCEHGAVASRDKADIKRAFLMIAKDDRVHGMKLLRQKEYPEGKFTLAFVGYGDESEEAAIEFTYNWDQDQYDLGDGFGHIALEVDDVYEATEEIRKGGGKILRDAGPMNAGTTIIAFVEDPDGYAIELIGKKD